MKVNEALKVNVNNLQGTPTIGNDLQDLCLYNGVVGTNSVSTYSDLLLGNYFNTVLQDVGLYTSVRLVRKGKVTKEDRLFHRLVGQGFILQQDNDLRH